MPGNAPTGLGVRPLRATGSSCPPPTLTSTHELVVTTDSGQKLLPASDFVVTAIQAAVPAALWSAAPGAAEPGAETIPNAVVGFEIVPKTKLDNPTGFFPVANCTVRTPVLKVTWTPPTQPQGALYSQAHAVRQLMTALRSPAVATELGQVTAALAVTRRPPGARCLRGPDPPDPSHPRHARRPGAGKRLGDR
jgi:hypothetical protein